MLAGDRGDALHAWTSTDKVAIFGAEESSKYLGRKLTLHDFHQTELANRLATGWRKSYQFRNELTNSRYPLRSRLGLLAGRWRQRS
eukprot:2943490-Pyramimonas_sp.AAC.1